MPDAPVVEVRRVVIQYEIQTPAAPMAQAVPATESAATPNIEELAEAVRRELIRTGNRNPDIFGGRA